MKEPSINQKKPEITNKNKFVFFLIGLLTPMVIFFIFLSTYNYLLAHYLYKTHTNLFINILDGTLVVICIIGFIFSALKAKNNKKFEYVLFGLLINLFYLLPPFMLAYSSLWHEEYQVISFYLWILVILIFAIIKIRKNNKFRYILLILSIIVASIIWIRFWSNKCYNDYFNNFDRYIKQNNVNYTIGKDGQKIYNLSGTDIEDQLNKCLMWNFGIRQKNYIKFSK